MAVTAVVYVDEGAGGADFMGPCISESMGSQDRLHPVALHHRKFPADLIGKSTCDFHLVLRISRLRHQLLGAKSYDYLWEASILVC